MFIGSYFTQSKIYAYNFSKNKIIDIKSNIHPTNKINTNLFPRKLVINKKIYYLAVVYDILLVDLQGKTFDDIPSHILDYVIDNRPDFYLCYISERAINISYSNLSRLTYLLLAHELMHNQKPLINIL